MANVNELIGKTLKKIDVIDTEAIIFYCEDGIKYKMYHEQD